MSESITLGAFVRGKQQERDELQKHVDEFHARGGQTQYLKQGECSEGMKTELQKAHARRKKK